MSYHFIQIPHYVDSSVYFKTIDKSVERLSQESSVVAVYQLGNINHPGISDIDLYAVFKDGEKCSFRLESQLDSVDRYLITHSIAGASEKHFIESFNYTLWDNLECIYGNDVLKVAKDELKYDNLKTLKFQTALEFLYKHYIDLSLQLSYGVIKLRTVLQHIKGVRYDIEFLGIKNSSIQAFVADAIEMLDNWFEQEFQPKEFSLWIDKYYKSLVNCLVNLEEDKTLYLPNIYQFHYGKNVKVIQSTELSFNRKGIFFNPAIISLHKKVFNAHQRINKFEVKLPYSPFKSNEYLENRFAFFEEYKKYNLEYLPHFAAFFPSLNHQLIGK